MKKSCAFSYCAISHLLLGVLTLIASVTINAKPLFPLQQWFIDEEAFVIVNVRVNGRSVISDLEAYYTKTNKLLLPVSVLKSTMGINFTFTKNALLASIEESQLSLDITSNKPSILLSDVTLWAKDDYDYYVELSIINRLLQTDATFDYSLMQVSFLSKLVNASKGKSFPFEAGKQVEALAYEHVVEDEYQLLTYPISEYALSSSYRTRDKRYKGLIRLNSYFDLFHHEAELRFNKSQSSVNTFFKVSKDFNLAIEALSLKSLHYQLGDIQSQSDSLISTSRQGRGFYISNTNPQSAQNFSAITIEEPALPGWQAELYRNGQFLAITQANNNNLVSFSDVETFYGNNVFEIKLFGPQGEQITRTQKYTVGLDALSPGKFSYQLEFIESDKNVFGQSLTHNTSFAQAFKSVISYGINDHFTFDAKITHLQGHSSGSSYISSGINVLANHGSYRFITTNQIDGGHAYFAGFRGLLSSDINTNVEFSLLDNFSSDLFLPQNNILKNKLSVSLNGKFETLKSTNWSLKWLSEAYESVGRKNYYSLGVSSNNINGTWSSRLLYNDENKELINQLYSSIDIFSWRLTNTLDWLPKKNGGIVSIRSNLRWPQTRDSFNQTQFTYNPDSSTSTKLTHQYTYRHNIFNLQFSGQYDSRGDWLFSLGLNGTFSFDHLTKSLLFDTPKALSAGQIEASSFIDWNENFVFDEDDEPLKDVSFTGNYLWRDKYTNSDGKALLPSSHGGQVLDVDLRSLPNPYLKPSVRRIKIDAHRGGQTRVNVPMVISNEVEGTIYFSVDGKTKPISGVTVRLHDTNSDKTYSTMTEYDGYYYFTNITHGIYSLSVYADVKDSTQLEIENLPEHIMTAKEGDTLILEDIILHDKGASDFTEKLPENIKEKSYFVQLGVFKKFESALIVANQAELKAYPVSLYKHRNRDNYYLVAGPFHNAYQAQKTINDVYSTPPFYGSSMVDANRYASLEWEVLGYWGSKLSEKHSLYFCQYGAYKFKTSVNADMLKVNPSLFIFDKKIKGENYSLLLSGPHNQLSSQGCDKKIENKNKSALTAIKKTWRSIAAIK